MDFIDNLPRIIFENGPHYLCAGCRQIFTQADRPMRIIAGLLRQKRAPAKIMQLYAMEDADRDSRLSAYAGRNDRYPCGSG